MRLVRGDGVEPGELAPIHALRAGALAGLPADRSTRAESLPHARLQLLAEAWRPLTIGGIAMLTWSDLQPHAAKTLATLGTEADRAEQMVIQWPRTRVDTAAAAEAARAWRRPQATLRALACTVTDLVTRQGMFGEGVGWASQYLATAERYGSVRDRVRALALLSRCHTALGSFAGAEEALARADALLPALHGTPSPAAEMLNDELTISRFAMAYFVDGSWRALLKSLPPREPPRPSGLILAAERCLGQWRAGSGAEARESVAGLLGAAAELPPLTLHRDAGLVTILAAAWEMGAAEHAAAGLSLAGLARDAGVGAQIEGTLELTEARLLGLAGRVTESRAAFAAARKQMAAAGLRPLLALADHDEAIVIAAASSRGHDEAIQLLGSAGEKFERLGMRGWSDRVSDLTRTGLDVAAAPGGRLAFTYQRGLSRPEADLVRLIAGGATLAEAAGELGLDQPEVDRLIGTALKKLRGKSADELPQLARRYGLGGL
jgi:DNA-binding CsgD family transcriptional regulator